MKSFIAASIVASALLAGSFSGASAFPVKAIDPLSGAFAGTSPTGGPLSGPPVPGLPTYSIGNTDYFAFDIPFQSSYSIAAYVGAVFTDAVQISSFKLYDSTGAFTPGTEFAQAMYTTYIPGKYLAIDPITLAQGEYFLGVVASGVNATGSSGYSGVLSVSNVPLPASAPMFGAALLALAAVGYGLKRKQAAATA